MDFIDAARYLLMRDVKQHIKLTYSPEQDESQLQHLLVILLIPAEDDRYQLDQLLNPLSEEMHRRLKINLRCPKYIAIEVDNMLDLEQQVEEGFSLWLEELWHGLRVKVNVFFTIIVIILSYEVVYLVDETLIWQLYIVNEPFHEDLLV